MKWPILFINEINFKIPLSCNYKVDPKRVDEELILQEQKDVAKKIMYSGGE